MTLFHVQRTAIFTVTPLPRALHSNIGHDGWLYLRQPLIDQSASQSIKQPGWLVGSWQLSRKSHTPPFPLGFLTLMPNETRVPHHPPAPFSSAERTKSQSYCNLSVDLGVCPRGRGNWMISKDENLHLETCTQTNSTHPDADRLRSMETQETRSPSPLNKIRVIPPTRDTPLPLAASLICPSEVSVP